jgi:steroid delta-isomerase-like uncharacterized protein
MNADSNKNLIRRFYDEVMSSGHVDILPDIMHENFVDHGEALFGSPHGREVLRRAIIATQGILSNLTVHLEDIIAEGDFVGVRGVMRCTQTGTFLGVPANGQELSWKGIAMFRIAEGKIAERWFNSDSVSIVRQLGLVSAAGPSRG